MWRLRPLRKRLGRVGVDAPLRSRAYPQVKRPPLGAELIVARLVGRDSPLFLLEELAEEAALRRKSEAPADLGAMPTLVEGRVVGMALLRDLLDSAPAVAGLEELGLASRGAGPIRAPCI